MAKTSASYIQKLKQQLILEWQGYHQKFVEIEKLRYYEDNIALRDEENQSGIAFRSGLTSELIENVKSALTSNKPVVSIVPGKKTPSRESNASRREKFWNQWLTHINRPVNVMSRLVDAQAMGIGILKASYFPEPERSRRVGERRDDYLERQEAQKRVWGPPFKVTDIHPLTYFPSLGAGNIPEEVIEISYKSRRVVMKNLKNDDGVALAQEEIDVDEIAAASGYPSTHVQGLPSGVNTDTLVEVTTYWNEDEYQIFIDGVSEGSGPVYSTDDPPIKYFMALGRTTSSRDPDKLSLSIAEYLRHNEPIINRTLTRMAEAAELIVQKRLALELAEGSFDDFTETAEGDNEPARTIIELEPGKLKAIPAGSRIQDPFAGVERVYDAMGLVTLAMDLAGRHGVSPIFKGVSSGSGASGYKDNSLYLMALSQFLYVRDSYQDALKELVQWAEYTLAYTVKTDIFLDDFQLSVSDITDFPAKVEVNLEPFLPQDTFRETQLMDQLASRGIVPRRKVLTDGLREGSPEEIEDEVMEEELRALMKPILYRDVLTEVGLKLPEQAGAETGLLDQNGNPVQSEGAPGGSPLGQEFSGARSGTRPRAPAQEPGTVG